jgi:hypothetical protein
MRPKKSLLDQRYGSRLTITGLGSWRRFSIPQFAQMVISPPAPPKIGAQHVTGANQPASVLSAYRDHLIRQTANC